MKTIVFLLIPEAHFLHDFPLKAFLNSVFLNLIKSPVCLCCPQKCRMKWKLNALKTYVPGESSCKQMPNSTAKHEAVRRTTLVVCCTPASLYTTNSAQLQETQARCKETHCQLNAIIHIAVKLARDGTASKITYWDWCFAFDRRAFPLGKWV